MPEKWNQMARKPGRISISSIAKELNLSPSTVSRVMNNRTGAGEETRRKVLEVLRKYDFKTNYPRPRSRKIAIVSGISAISEYSAAVISGICGYVRRSDLSACMIQYDANNGESLLSTLRDQQCAGVILLIPASFREQLPELSASGLPVMLVDESVELPNVGFIDNDSYSGSFQAAEHLLSLGHRAIGYLNQNATLNHLQRFRAWRDALEQSGIRIPPEWSCEFGGGGAEEGFRKMNELLDAAPEITAVMATNDQIAWGAARAALRRGLRIPQDLSVVGFDDYPASAFWNPPLTTVCHPMEEAGRLAARALDRYFCSNGKEALPKQLLQTHLIARESTGPRPGEPSFR